LLNIADDNLSLEIIIVDDCSTDKSFAIATDFKKRFSNIILLRHERNKGKGAAFRTGFTKATGDFVAVQDADLEYDPIDLKRLLKPLINDVADVVFGSRFLSTNAHRVLYFWHYIGNRILTLLSNMFTDLNLTDMESGYKVFRRDVLQKINIEEDGFGFEPEIVAKVAHMRLRIYEMGISYYGRTYEEGKKIGLKDGLRALYCILRYNAHRAPVPIQIILYLLTGGCAAVINLIMFEILFFYDYGITISTLSAFFIAAVANYFFCILILFRHKAKWNSGMEILTYIVIVGLVSLFDLAITKSLFELGISPSLSKMAATALVFILNFLGRRYFVFPEPTSGPWRSRQDPAINE
jgi:glycosyltransferase involved in cell wall biosynthesis